MGSVRTTGSLAATPRHLVASETLALGLLSDVKREVLVCFLPYKGTSGGVLFLLKHIVFVE